MWEIERVVPKKKSNWNLNTTNANYGPLRLQKMRSREPITTMDISFHFYK